MKPSLLPFVLSLVPLVSQASLHPTDFAYGMYLEGGQGAAVYRLSLPEAVYRISTREDLGDVRVFNSSGETVPYGLQRPQGVKRDSPPPVSLPVFPFERRAADPGRVSVQVATDEGGAVVSVGAAGGYPENEPVLSYLVDATAVDQCPSVLRFDWTGPDVLTLSVEGGNDFTRWVPLARNLTVARLHYAGHRLEQRDVPLPGGTYKYFRVRAESASRGLSLSRVEGWFSPAVEEPRREWGPPASGVLTEGGSNVWLFDSGGRMPVDRVRLELPQINSLVTLELKSRPDDSVEWRHRGSGTLYRLKANGADFENRTLEVVLQGDRYWRVELISDPSGLGTTPPRLEFGWIPHELEFLARGDWPFLLAYGSGDEAVVPRAPLETPVNATGPNVSDGLIGTALAREPIKLGGDGRLSPAPERLPWRSFVLWATLVLGVAILGHLAWRLFREMNAGGGR